MLSVDAMPVVISILALSVIQDHSHRRSGSWDGVTRAGRWDLLTCLALISLGASELAACTGQWPFSLSPLSAAQSQASVSQLPSDRIASCSELGSRHNAGSDR
jgi:hypothetical protein